MTTLLSRFSPLVTVERVPADAGRCKACVLTLDARGLPEPPTDTTVLEVVFRTGGVHTETGMALHYCAAHFAQVLAELQEAQP
jgi:hypothetical protein